MLRGFIGQIVIPPDNGLLQVAGNLGAMSDAAAGQKMPGPPSCRVLLVAGACNRCDLLDWWIAA